MLTVLRHYLDNYKCVGYLDVLLSIRVMYQHQLSFFIHDRLTMTYMDIIEVVILCHLQLCV